MNTATICSVRIPKSDSAYVQVAITYQDDSTRYFYGDGDKFDLAVIKREFFEANRDAFVVGLSVRYWYSSTVKDNKTRWFLNIEPA